MPPRPTLITGAAGFAGRHVIDRLAGRGPLIGWHRPGCRTPTLSTGVIWQPVDVHDRDAVYHAIASTSPARIYHLAGLPHVASSWDDVVPHLETNVVGTHHVLDAVRRTHAACRVLVVSSAMVYQMGPDPLDESARLRPANPYGLSKLAQDQLALRAVDEDALDVVVARSFNHAGPRQDPSFAVSSFARQIARIEAGLAEPVIHVGNLDARRDITDVRDVAEAYELLMAHGAAGRAYNICSGRAERVGDVLDKLLSLSGTPVRVVTDEERLRPSEIPIVLGSFARIHQETGWQPQRTIADMLRDTLEWWRAHAESA